MIFDITWKSCHNPAACVKKRVWAMANRTDPDADTVHGANPQFLVDRIVRVKIYNETWQFWRRWRWLEFAGKKVPLLRAMLWHTVTKTVTSTWIETLWFTMVHWLFFRFFFLFRHIYLALAQQRGAFFLTLHSVDKQQAFRMPIGKSTASVWPPSRSSTRRTCDRCWYIWFIGDRNYTVIFK